MTFRRSRVKFFYLNIYVVIYIKGEERRGEEEKEKKKKIEVSEAKEEAENFARSHSSACRHSVADKEFHAHSRSSV